MQSHVTKRGELVNLSSRFVADPAKAAGANKPKLTVARKLKPAPRNRSVKRTRSPTVPTRLIWLPMNATTLRLCWDVTLLGEFARRNVPPARGCADRRSFGAPLFDDVSCGDLQRLHQRQSIAILAGLVRAQHKPAGADGAPLVTIDALSTNASPEGWLPDWTSKHSTTTWTLMPIAMAITRQISRVPNARLIACLILR